MNVRTSECKVKKRALTTLRIKENSSRLFFSQSEEFRKIGKNNRNSFVSNKTYSKILFSRGNTKHRYSKLYKKSSGYKQNKQANISKNILTLILNFHVHANDNVVLRLFYSCHINRGGCVSISFNSHALFF